MANVAALYVMSRNGAFNGLFDSDPLIVKAALGIKAGVELIKDAVETGKKLRADEEWDKQPARFADIPERSPLIENYLKGGAKLVMNIGCGDEPSVTITTKKGKTVKFESYKLKKEDAAQYRQFIEKKLEMIEPPSFLEKLMVLNKQLAESKAGRVASAATLGVLPAAVGVVALSARAYGATRGFIMEKLNLSGKNEEKDKNKKTFKERLKDLKHRIEYKTDLERFSEVESVLQKADDLNRENEAYHAGKKEWKKTKTNNPDVKTGVARSKEFNELIKVSGNTELAGYLDGALQLYSGGNLTRRYVYNNYPDAKEDLDISGLNSPYPSATAQSIVPFMQRYSKALEMIEPPTKTELMLVKQIHQLTSNYNVKDGKKLLEAVNNTAAMYISEKQKENKNFGKESMFERLNDLRKRSIIEERMHAMQSLHAALKKKGR